MKKIIKLSFLIFIILTGFLTQAQLNLDSLWGVWHDNKAPDTGRMLALRMITVDFYMYSKPDSAGYFAQMLYEFASEGNLRKEMADALNILGISSYVQSDYEKALNYYQQSLKIKKEVYDSIGIAKTLNNIGMIYTIQGEYQKAMEYYQESLKIIKIISNKDLMANILSNIGKIAKNQGNFPKAINYYQQSLEIREEISNKDGMANTLNRLGSIYYSQGFYIKALSYYQRSLVINEETSNKRGVASALNNIGLIYLKRNDYSNALNYFQRSILIKDEIADKNGMAITLNNIGLVHKKLGNYSNALGIYEQSLMIREEISDKRGIAGILNNIGELYMSKGDHKIANEYFHRSLSINKEISDKSQSAINLINIGKLSNIQNQYTQAIIWCEKALHIAEEIKVIEEQKMACGCLYDAFKFMEDSKKALEYHERVKLLDDSLQAKETARKLQQMEFKRQMQADSLIREKERLNIQIAHEKEVEKKKRTRNIFLATALLFLILAFGFYRRLLFVRKAKRAIEYEKNRSDYLLLNILPSEIAEELKEKGRANAKKYETVSILFTDFKEFTQISEKLSAEELVQEINTCFKAFDAICQKYAIEKIKTIGDAYMAVGGLPVPLDDSVKNTVQAAIEMAEFMINRKSELEKEGSSCFEMRLGIHTGSVVAGIVGETKFQYDIWGDAVNIASCMENSGKTGKVNISRATYELLKDDPRFTFESRGVIEVKGKGKMDMWFVSVKK